MLRQIIRQAQSNLKQFILGLIKVYQFCLSPFFGNCCRFYPSCSSYAKTSIERYGVFKGSYYTLRRLLKCHPLHPGGYDPVPEKQK